jgi:YggT family protein
MNHFGDAATFVVETVFGLYLMAVMLRFFLQYVRADFYNPISQFLVKVTQPPLRPLRRFIPSYGNLDTASLVLMFTIQFAEIWLVFALRGAVLSAFPMLILSFAFLLEAALNLFFFAILIRVILSWLGPQGPNPVLSIIDSLTGPMLNRTRRMLPALSMGGLDLTPLLVLMALHLGKLLLVRPIAEAAYKVAGAG